MPPPGSHRVAPGAESELVLELRGVTKRFGAFVANDAADLEVRRGEIHALLGENGAGKSTLMNCLYGLYHPDAGSILIDGVEQRFHSSSDAIDAGIGMVHQHFMLIPVMTVAENIVLAAEPRSGPVFDRGAAEERVRELSDRYGLAVDPKAAVRDIGVGQQQRAEILKALYREAKVLILDEPTAVLTPQEIEDLFRVVRELTESGTSVIIITHKLDEVLAIADRVTVLRRGTKVGTVDAAGATKTSLAEMMVGRSVLLRVERPPASPGEEVLSVSDLAVADDRGLPAVRGISFTVRAGEIVGIAGVDGNGQKELVEAITGMRKAQSGVIRISGREIENASPRTISALGVGHVPEDRQVHGLVLDFSLSENVVLHDVSRAPASSRGFLDRDAMRARAEACIDQYDVRCEGPDARASSLSGGNQQKLILAREIESNPKLIVASQPTRGVDVGAIEFIHRRLVEQRDAGKGILLISFELDEILNLADRVLVLYAGRLVLERASAETDDRELGFAMTGGNEGADEGGVAA